MNSKKRDPPARHWCFTLFRPEGWESIDGKDPANLYDPENMTYIIYQIERSPETHNIHLQGYFSLKRKQRFTPVKRLFQSDKVHLEKCRATPQQNIDYCSKSESHIAGPWEYGKRPDDRGNVSALSYAVDDIQSGKSLQDVAIANPTTWVHSYRGLTSLASLLNKPKTTWRQVTTYVHWGPPRTGKTRLAMDTPCNDGRPPYRLPLSSGFWFDGYDGESVLVIDDFYGQIKFHDMLNLLDGYYSRVAVKGGFVWGVWEKVFITSNVHPDSWWPGIRSTIPQASWLAMQSRFSEIIEFKGGEGGPN